MPRQQIIVTPCLCYVRIARVAHVHLSRAYSSAGQGGHKKFRGGELGIGSTYPVCTSDKLVAYAERIRSTPDEMYEYN